MSTLPLRPDDVLRRAHLVGNYYGFTPFAQIAESRKGMKTRMAYPEGLPFESLDPVAQDVATFLKQVRELGLAPSVHEPLFVWHTNAAAGRPAPKNLTIQFHALGAERPIADAVLIRAVRSLVTDLAKEEPVIRVNSMGDKETRARFSRELTTFFRKNGGTLPERCVTCAKKDLMEAAELLISEACAEDLPSSTDHLSEASRKHFEELLEYLEDTATPYELSPHLLSRGGAWSDTCFEMRTDGEVRAWGSRYNDLARQFFKSSLPSVGALIRFPSSSRDVVKPMKDSRKPRFVFVHIGMEAKRESMRLADELRHARLPLTQSIGVESLTEQMRLAEKMNPPYLIIMGRKEALERAVILRERATHTESVIPLSELTARLAAVG
ncbi:MAG: hypothetical protein KGI41_03420 [Patescibacteria group bacterium]|nr:hypothetical protein [Patescibacteria group bacterium]MDE1966260.1 hypothetical protein [Patescibacteria group bacterium]